MPRILAIDYGTKRVGLAVTDSLGIIATPLTTVLSHELFSFLDNYFSKEEVESILVGDPKDLSNQDSDTTRFVTLFAQTLQKKFPLIPVHRYDERFTSLMATKSLIESGQSKKTRRDKAIIDKVSATLLLQSYLNQLSFKK